jgi:P27 family predicted phage terminase small subunit
MADSCPWIAESDRATMVLLCEKVDRRAKMQADLAKSDFVLYTDKMYAYPNPLVGMLSTIEGEISQLLSKLGLTPADRTRLGVAEVKAKNAFEEMLAKRAKREG